MNLTGSNGRECHILIAEDQPENASLLLDYLFIYVSKELPGEYFIYKAKDGNEAMAQVDTCQTAGKSLDLAIIDLRMPGKNGFETIDDLFKIYPSTHVMVISATTSLHLDRLAKYGDRVTLMEKGNIRLHEFVDKATSILRSGGHQYAQQ